MQQAGDIDTKALSANDPKRCAKSVTNRLLLKSRLYDLLLKEDKSLKPHLDEFYSIMMSSQNIEVNIEDEELTINLLWSLPPSYKHYRENLLCGRDNLSSDYENFLNSKGFD